MNSPYPILGFTFGTIAFLGIGFALAGCKPRNSISDLADTIGELGKAVGTMGIPDTGRLNREDATTVQAQQPVSENPQTNSLDENSSKRAVEAQNWTRVENEVRSYIGSIQGKNLANQKRNATACLDKLSLIQTGMRARHTTLLAELTSINREIAKAKKAEQEDIPAQQQFSAYMLKELNEKREQLNKEIKDITEWHEQVDQYRKPLEKIYHQSKS